MDHRAGSAARGACAAGPARRHAGRQRHRPGRRPGADLPHSRHGPASRGPGWWRTAGCGPPSPPGWSPRRGRCRPGSPPAPTSGRGCWRPTASPGCRSCRCRARPGVARPGSISARCWGALAQRGVTRVLAEGGAGLAAGLLRGGSWTGWPGSTPRESWAGTGWPRCSPCRLTRFPPCPDFHGAWPAARWARTGSPNSCARRTGSMFTGIVDGPRHGARSQPLGDGNDMRLVIGTSPAFLTQPAAAAIGASIACSGCCLTAVERRRLVRRGCLGRDAVEDHARPTAGRQRSTSNARSDGRRVGWASGLGPCGRRRPRYCRRRRRTVGPLALPRAAGAGALHRAEGLGRHRRRLADGERG